MNSKSLKLSESWGWSAAFALAFTGGVLVSGCASDQAATSARNGTSSSARLTFYTVPFR